MIRARFSLIHIPSPEEERVLHCLTEWVKDPESHPSRMYRWTVTAGLVESPGARDVETELPQDALDKVRNTPADAGTLFVFLDLHHHTEQPDVIRRLRECAHALRGTDNTLILLSPELHVPGDLEKEMAVADFPLPSPEDLRELVDRNYRDLRANPQHFDHAVTQELLEDVVRACGGLTETEADDALARAIIECGGLGPDVVDSINRTKREVIRKIGSLESVEVDHGMEAVGGLDNLKEWVIKRQRIFSEEARRQGLSYPKGLLTMGVPGGGKGLSARAVAHQWRLPLLRLDMGAIMGKYVGESEGNLREALKVAEAIAPVVLWVDELEKAFGGGGLDGGTSKRVFGSFLTWLQEKQKPVFCYFTANDVSQLPPELLRKGRIDEIFFIDLPNREERVQILRIHLLKRGKRPENYDVDMLAAACEGFVGSEIEALIEEAMVHAFSEDRGLETGDMSRAIRRTQPMVRTQRDKIDRLLEFVDSGRAVRASRGERVKLDRVMTRGEIALNEVGD